MLALILRALQVNGKGRPLRTSSASLPSGYSTHRHRGSPVLEVLYSRDVSVCEGLWGSQCWQSSLLLNSSSLGGIDTEAGGSL